MSGVSLLKFVCKDSMCLSEIPVSNLETSVECWECGIKYDQTALKDAEPVSNYEELKEKCTLRMLLARLLPKKGAELVKVNGLSNYYCKLLSPLLTQYGMDPVTGSAKLLTEMNSEEDILDCSRFKDRAFLINPSQLSIVGFGRDVSGSLNYLSATMKIIREANEGEERLVPIYTDGDGHCLVHAISRAVIGRELFWHPLRCCLKKHFVENLSRYQELFKDFMEPEDWQAIIEESDPDFKPPEGELHGLRNVHIFGLANVLKRPIILLDSLECMKKCGDYSALFLPGFIPPEECSGRYNTLNKPICIAWSSFSHNHYIPLVGVHNSPLPVLPYKLIPKVWGMPQSEFEKYIELDNKGNCIIGGSRTLTEQYVQRLVNSMETLFLEKNGVHPMLVADAKLYFYSDPAYLNVKAETVIENTRALVAKNYLYRCLYCKALCKFDLQPSFFRPGGLVYNLLFEEYKSFRSDKSYKVADSGLSCKYDSVKNEFYPDMTNTILPSCTLCESPNVQMVMPDGTTDGFTGNESSTNAASLVSSQENSSITNKMFETRTIPSQESQSLGKVLKSENVSSEESGVIMNKMMKFETVSSQNNKLSSDKSETDVIEKEKDDLLFINFKWKGEAVQHSISSAEFKELGSSSGDCVSTLAFQIAAKYFPNDYHDVHLHVQVSDEIWNQISKTSVDKFKLPASSPIREDKNEEKNISEESASECANSVFSEPQYIKVVTSSGQQGNLALSKDGLSYFQLQEWISIEFKIPVNNQKIKWGFPPKEFEVPANINEPNLPLKHGDRLLVENKNLSVSQQKNYLNTTPHNSRFDSQGYGDSNVPSEILWAVVKCDPDMLKKGGSLFEDAVNKLILCDKTHITLPVFPTKRFCYNAASNCLELCVKPIGHFQVSSDIDDRIERARRGENVPGVKKCPLTTGPSKESIVPRPYRKPITPSPEESLPYFRKGPGFSVLSKPPEDMDYA